MAMQMFPNESPRTWRAVGLLGCAAVLLLLGGATNDHVLILWSSPVVTVLLVAALWISRPPGSLNRTLAQIQSDFASKQ
jgi:hypothetical protein